MILVPYEQARPQIKEADVLLFRGEGLMSWMIKRYGGGAHSHAATLPPYYALCYIMKT